MTAVERYVQEQNKIIAKDKIETLTALGIVEKEYSPNGLWSGVYNKSEIVNGEKKYFREVAAKVTDEEYVLILQKATQVQEIQLKREKKRIEVADSYDTAEDRESSLAKKLRIASWLICITAIIGAIIITMKTENLAVFIGVLLLAVIELLLCYSLAEILDHLKEIAYYTRKR